MPAFLFLPKRMAPAETTKLTAESGKRNST